ncbi:hypothetical protein [Hallerella porci]|uniref:Por secretion system C-terminal sorting domain-containing protein n=1 Tax=Hallerella porci TaxID=1945871 RepID=A0ABX5LL07_9BACT|nr:hypothetical protein [Hallerella porci]PWK92267.1 hypothetical protein B0H50_13618 [Hallerella porci]
MYFGNSLASATVITEDLTKIEYDGNAKTPAVMYVIVMGDTLNRLTDYSVTYSNNVNFGTATINVCGTGSYTDCKIVNFEIVGTIITPTIGIIADQPYTGSAVTPSVKVYNGETLLASSNYTVSYKNNVDVGEATATVTLKNNYVGTASKTFNIVAAKITPTIAAIADQEYTGSAITPSVKVYADAEKTKLLEEYTVSYSNNVSYGTAKVTVTLSGNYAGTATQTFRIVGKAITPTIGIIADQPYTGSALTPNVYVYNGETLLASSNYTVTYKNNINVGEATVTVTLKGNFSGTATQTFNIVPAKITPTIATIADQTYTGSAIKPTVKVMNGSTEIASSNYTVTYEDNVNEGVATVIVELNGNYTGTASTTFNIVKSTKIRDMKKQSFKVISTNALNIHISNANIGTLCALFDLQGRLLKRFVIQNVDEVIQVDHSGAYLLKVGNETHKISVK